VNVDGVHILAQSKLHRDQLDLSCFCHVRLLFAKCTRKPCYRKDDRAMRPIYGCPEKFRQSLATPTATFPEIFNGLLL